MKKIIFSISFMLMCWPTVLLAGENLFIQNKSNTQISVLFPKSATILFDGGQSKSFSWTLIKDKYGCDKKQCTVQVKTLGNIYLDTETAQVTDVCTFTDNNLSIGHEDNVVTVCWKNSGLCPRNPKRC